MHEPVSTCGPFGRLCLLVFLTIGSEACEKGERGEKTGPTAPPCESPASIDDRGAPTGFERCADGAINRRAAVAVSVGTAASACEGTEDRLLCTGDEDCAERPNGHCISSTNFEFTETYCGCVYACETDADCASNGSSSTEICAPSSLSGNFGLSGCIYASCAENDSCESGQCGYSTFSDGCGSRRSLACRAAMDTCHTSDDCLDPGYPQCASTSSEGYTCLSDGCSI